MLLSLKMGSHYNTSVGEAAHLIRSEVRRAAWRYGSRAAQLCSYALATLSVSVYSDLT